LPCVAIPIDHEKHHGNTIEQRDARLVELADAAVLLGDATEMREFLARAAAKGLRVVAVGARPSRRGTGEAEEEDDGTGMVHRLPD